MHCAAVDTLPSISNFFKGAVAGKFLSVQGVYPLTNKKLVFSSLEEINLTAYVFIRDKKNIKVGDMQ